MISITKTQLAIIKLLLTKKEPLNIRGLSRELKKSYALVYNNLQDLVKKEIISFQSLPPTQIVTLNETISKELLIFAEKEKTTDFLHQNKWGQLFTKDIISSTASVFFILLVFGSYAKNKATKKSDLDLLAIVPKKEDIPFLETSINKTYTKVKKQIIVIEEKDFLEMVKNSRQFNVGNEAVENHLILCGFEQYYSLLEKIKR